jgi:hypothetical protein
MSAEGRTGAEFTVRFRAKHPDNLQVGEEVLVSGLATVQAVRADLVDISSQAAKRYALGDTVEVKLIANRFEVERP